MFNRAYVEITNVCNLACSFCPGTRRPAGYMRPEDFRLLAEKLRGHTAYLYLHVTGEPLLHPQLTEILRICTELDYRVCLTTNGTLLPEQLPLLRDCSALHKVSVSLHSFEGNGKSGTALGNVGGTGQGQPVGEAKLGQLAKVDQGVHMVDTGHNGDGVQTAHDEGTDAERQLN